MSTFLLPPTIAISCAQLDGNYLRYSADRVTSTGGITLGNLRFDGGNVFSPLARFQVVGSNTGTGLVHIRCIQNKKFLRRISEIGSGYLTADADEPQEDQSRWDCTLFEPQMVEGGDPDRARLLHVRTRHWAVAMQMGTVAGPGEMFMTLHLGMSNWGVFDIIDLESLVMLPRHVAFKAPDGKYLRNVGTNQLLKMESTDKGNSESWFEVVTGTNGWLQIKSYHDNSYVRKLTDSLRLSSNAQADAATDPDGFFWPMKVDNTTVALKCRGHGRFVWQDGDHLIANQTSIRDTSRLTLEELVISRRIYDAEYDLSNAIIYGETPIVMTTANATNDTSADNTVEFNFAYTQSQSNSWNSSHSWMVGIEVQISARIPFGLGGIQNTYSAEYNGSYEWGETITTEQTLEATYTVTVPANTSISVSLLATKGNADVPYSYYQRDVLYNGRTVIYKKDDGLYKGISSYNFRYEVTTLKEPASRADLSNKEVKLPDPLTDPSRQQMLPMPVHVPAMMPGSTTKVVQNKVTVIATTPEEKLSSLKLEESAGSDIN